MAAAMPKVGDGCLYGRHLLTNDQHLGVEVFKLLFKSCFPYALLHAPMLPSSDVLFISVEDRILFIT